MIAWDIPYVAEGIRFFAELADKHGGHVAATQTDRLGMQIAITAAGFSPAKADRLRRSMATFKRTGRVDEFKKDLVSGMVANGYPQDFAERCFSQIEGFGEYGFPESHAASFALIAYASSYVKCHYPDAFCAALLNSQPMGFYAPAQIVGDALDHPDGQRARAQGRDQKHRRTGFCGGSHARCVDW